MRFAQQGLTLRIAQRMLRSVRDLIEGWAEEIRAQLDAKGKSQRWLADLCDVHPSTIHRVVTGEHNPNDELKWKIAGALGMRMDLLFAWPKIVPPSPEKDVA